ncbi:MAG TPA: hypothetical protein VF469_40105 [Kofleriaceae bacterium]
MTAPLDRIEAALAQLGAEHEPPEGWEARVLAAVRAEQQPRRPWWRIAVPALTLATAAGIAVLIWWPRAPSPGPLAFVVVAESPTQVRGAQRGPTRVRGEGVEARVVGDVVHATVSGGAGRRAIRVYRNEAELVIACPGSSACRVSRDRITVDLTLDKVGLYTVVAIASEEALPAMPGIYNADTAAAIRAKATLGERQLRAD